MAPSIMPTTAGKTNEKTCGRSHSVPRVECSPGSHWPEPTGAYANVSPRPYRPLPPLPDDSGVVANYTDDDTGLPWGDMDERVEVGGAPAAAYDAYAAWALHEYGYRKVMVDLPLAMWAETPLHKAYHDGWKTP